MRPVVQPVKRFSQAIAEPGEEAIGLRRGQRLTFGWHAVIYRPAPLLAQAAQKRVPGHGHRGGSRLLRAFHQGQEEVVDLPDRVGELVGVEGLMT